MEQIGVKVGIFFDLWRGRVVGEEESSVIGFLDIVMGRGF